MLKLQYPVLNHAPKPQLPHARGSEIQIKDALLGVAWTHEKSLVFQKGPASVKNVSVTC